MTSPRNLARVLSAAVLLVVLAVVMTPVASMAADDADDADAPRLDAGLLSGLELRGIGPALMSGRIADIVTAPDDPGTWYVAVGSGGIWKTENAGTTWRSIFEGQGSYSIGCLAIDPSNPRTIWVGTGENVSGRHVGYGDGVYRSRDGGQTWEHRGLAASEHIGRIVVHPDDPDVVFVAAQGPLWSAGGERGVFVTRDGGDTWEKVLGGGEYTGAGEVHMDPRDPDVLYATTWQRFRDVALLVDGGPETGIHKSTDGGRTWRRLETGLPGEDMGKIGLAISPQNPDVVYAAIELGRRKGGFWRSDDGGESWQKRSDKVARGTGPHYYQEIFASPHAFDRVYFMDVQMAVTHDGGATFAPVGEEHKHVDNHALAFSPDDPDYLLAGCDGGLYESWDLGRNWKFAANLPVTQFYKLAVDDDEPFYHVIGGTQDNNTQYGPSRTDNVHGIANRDWSVTLFGDGHQPAIERGNPDIIYSSMQQCGMWRVDRVTGEQVPIRPRPRDGEPEERWNWDGPIFLSAHDPARIYMASQRLWRSDDRGDSWRPLSGDLTRGEDRLQRPVMGRVWSVDAPVDLLAMSMYGTITSIAESPRDGQVLYVGTDDGLIHATEDGGATWRACRLPKALDDHIYVNHLLADRFDRATVYAVLDAHKQGDFRPQIWRSDDAGRSWTSMTGDLPDRHVVWRLAQDHVQPSLFFAATEFGLFTSVDAGRRWIKLEGGAPTIAFRDLVIQEREDDLVAASFGRGFWILDDYSALRDMSEDALAEPAQLFAPRRAWWYIQRRVIGGSEKAAQGAAWFTAPNPPFGAVFTYYLRDAVPSLEEARLERESELADEGEDTPYPGWDALRQEELEDAPAVTLVVRDGDGRVVRRVAGATKAGLHRTAWDLRLPPASAQSSGRPDEGSGPLAAPGTYTVELERRVDGMSEVLAGPVSFDVTPLRERGQPGLAPAEYAAFAAELHEVQARVAAVGARLSETGKRLDAIKAALDRAGADASLYATAVDLEKRTEELRERMNGNRRRSRLNDAQPMSVSARLEAAQGGVGRSTYGPTAMHREQMDLAIRQLDAVAAATAAIADSELPALEAALDDLGVVWTPGRPAR